MCIYIYIYMNVHICNMSSICIHICIRICVYTYKYIYTHILMYTYTYTYIYTYTVIYTVYILIVIDRYMYTYGSLPFDSINCPRLLSQVLCVYHVVCADLLHYHVQCFVCLMCRYVHVLCADLTLFFVLFLMGRIEPQHLTRAECSRRHPGNLCVRRTERSHIRLRRQRW